MFNLPFKDHYIGVDLMTSDIVRGRDNGLPPYNQVRHLCGYPLAKDFEDLLDLIHLKVMLIIIELDSNIYLKNVMIIIYIFQCLVNYVAGNIISLINMKYPIRPIFQSNKQITIYITLRYLKKNLSYILS